MTPNGVNVVFFSYKQASLQLTQDIPMRHAVSRALQQIDGSGNSWLRWVKQAVNSIEGTFAEVADHSAPAYP